jgi:hypothetical protein
MAVVIMAEDEHDQKRIEDIIAKAVKVAVVLEIICAVLTCSFGQNGEIEDFGTSPSSSKKRRSTSKKKTSEAAEAEALLKAIQVQL